MRVVRWTDDALNELDSIIAYIQERNFFAAEKMRLLFENTAARIPLHPYMHRPGRVGGTREAIIRRNYLLVYSIEDDTIWILSVLHARQQYP